MPIHDWTRVTAGIFHHFHHRWTSAIADALNDGLLPPDYFALAEQKAGGLGPDVLTLQSTGDFVPDPSAPSSQPVAVTERPPRVRFTATSDMKNYTGRLNTVVVRHSGGDRVVARVEVVSPGNKASREPFRRFIEKVVEALERGYHLLLLDLLPLGKNDPEGIHGAIWEVLEEEPAWQQPADKPLTLAAYDAADMVKYAYVEPIAVGDELTPMPLFLRPKAYIEVPPEATYQRAWHSVPLRWRRVLE